MMNSIFLTDGYKLGHHRMYPEETSKVVSNFTPRSAKYAPNGIDKVISFGQQMVVRYIKDHFDQNFFSQPKEKVINEIKEEFSMYLNMDYNVDHFAELHDLGYLPIKVKSLPEGTRVPMGVPVLTIYNTIDRFYWVTNFLETLISNLLWKPMTSATIADNYRRVLTKWALNTNKEGVGIVDFQGHDFSMRGMDSPFAAMSSGMGHITSFLGTDSLPAIYGARKFYDAEGFVAGSVNATEHSVMCAGTGFYILDKDLSWEKYGEAEIEVFKKLLRDFPEGILSVVSDTWNLWVVLTEYLKDPEVKALIESREGTLVIRPDSGDPVDIVCGLNTATTDEGNAEYYEHESFEEIGSMVGADSEAEFKGVIELLWDEYGGTINDQGYKVLNPKIGAIYGDSITPERADKIAARLAAKKFASTNVVLGVGSFTYQFNTRDTFGFAMKATYCEVKRGNGVEGIEIYKDPITDDGTKKSARGLLKVYKAQGAHGNSDYILKDRCTWAEESEGDLQVIFEDGTYHNVTTFEEIRKRIKNER